MASELESGVDSRPRNQLSKILNGLAALDSAGLLDFTLVAIPRPGSSVKSEDLDCWSTGQTTSDTSQELSRPLPAFVYSSKRVQLPADSSYCSDRLYKDLVGLVSEEARRRRRFCQSELSADGLQIDEDDQHDAQNLEDENQNSLMWLDGLVDSRAATTIRFYPFETTDDSNTTAAPTTAISPADVQSPMQNIESLHDAHSCLTGQTDSIANQSDHRSQAQLDRPAPLHLQCSDELPLPQFSSKNSRLVYYPLAICDSGAVSSFLEAKFRELQQVVCKLVAKAWIKVIEPRKQVTHPYNKGDNRRPDWWPAGVRHKEPDHLMKPERLLLLVTIAHTKRNQVDQLRLATNKCSAMFPAEKMEILEDIYYVLEMQEKYSVNLAGVPGKLDPSPIEETIIWTVSSRSLVSLASRLSLRSSMSLKRPFEAYDEDNGAGGDEDEDDNDGDDESNPVRKRSRFHFDREATVDLADQKPSLLCDPNQIEPAIQQVQTQGSMPVYGAFAPPTRATVGSCDELHFEPMIEDTVVVPSDNSSLALVSPASDTYYVRSLPVTTPGMGFSSTSTTPLLSTPSSTMSEFSLESNLLLMQADNSNIVAMGHNLVYYTPAETNASVDLCQEIPRQYVLSSDKIGLLTPEQMGHVDIPCHPIYCSQEDQLIKQNIPIYVEVKDKCIDDEYNDSLNLAF
ncbi:uncharacterized protein V1516DRAFT_711017 [Lipomyces oligophaga]|uniref:uncharacterized protein n=1 Tax=Lipomyces oligophaga TaxID=45792 RepID=UPI0034CD6941